MFPARSRNATSRVKAAARQPDHVREAQQLLLPLMLAFVLAMLLAWPQRLPAQAAVTASSSGTHTVRVGETLWSLAARYYGDGHKWRDLAAMNGLAEGGERGIAVGQVLRVPTSTPPLAEARAALAEAPPSRTPRAATTPAGRVEPRPGDAIEGAVPPAAEAPKTEAPKAEAPKTEAPKAEEPKPEAPKAEAPKTEAPKTEAPKADEPTVTTAVAPLSPVPAPRVETPAASMEEPRVERRIGLVRQTDLARARGRDNATVFIGPAPFDKDTMSGTIWLSGDETFVAPATRRVGEFHAAPIALADSAWRSAGRVNVRALATGSSAGRGVHRMQQSDLVEVTLPAGADSTPGTQFVAVTQGSDLGRGARLALPTGVLTLETPRDGVPIARVRRLYGVIEQGQALLPYVEAPDAPASESVSPVEATVRWITDAPLLPSLLAYLVLSTDEIGEVQTGDRFQLLADDPPGARVATVRVVRVTAEGATAIVVGHEQPGIKVGMRAVRVGRAP